VQNPINPSRAHLFWQDSGVQPATAFVPAAGAATACAAPKPIAATNAAASSPRVIFRFMASLPSKVSSALPALHPARHRPAE
jgi:hypothetical protein